MLPYIFILSVLILPQCTQPKVTRNAHIWIFFYSICSCFIGGAADPRFFSDNDGRHIKPPEQT